MTTSGDSPRSPYVTPAGRVLSCPECGYQIVWRDGEPPTVQHSVIPNEHALVRTEGETE